MAPLSIYYQNVNGLRTKLPDFKKTVAQNSFDIICLTETFLSERISDCELFDERYIVLRRDRDYSETGQNKGGGVLIAVRREIVAFDREEWRSCAEDLWVTLPSIKSGSEEINMHICVAYIWKQTYVKTFSEQLDNFQKTLMNVVLSQPADKFIILGDFNLPNIEWEFVSDGVLYPGKIQNGTKSAFMDCLDTCKLLQFNRHENSNGKILDLILSNDKIEVSTCRSPLVIEDQHHRALHVTADFHQHHQLNDLPRDKLLHTQAINDEFFFFFFNFV